MEFEKQLINTYEQHCADGGDRIILYYHNAQTGRASTGAKFSVSHMKAGQQYITDSKAPWYNYGKMTFEVNWTHSKDFPREGTVGQRRKQALAEATAWVTEKYGAREFVKNRVGDYVEKEVNDKFPIPKREK